MHRPRLFTSQHPLAKRGRDVGFGALAGALTVPLLSNVLSDDEPANAATTAAKEAPLGPAQAAHNAAQAALAAPPSGTPSALPEPPTADEFFNWLSTDSDKAIWTILLVCALLGLAIFMVNSRGQVVTSGMASRSQLRRSMTRHAIYREARPTTPALQVPRHQRRRIPVSRYAAYLGSASEHYLLKLYAGYRDIVMLVGPPQTGKTALLGHWVLDAPGCVVTTSTKPDVYNMTHAHRLLFGRVHVFNPEGLGGLLSDLRWNPITGCGNPEVAEERAASLLQGAGQDNEMSDSGFWNGLASELLRYYMHAAALEGKSFRDMWEWTQNPEDKTAYNILRTHEEAEYGWADAMNGMLAGPDKTVKSIFITLRRALRFMSNPQAAAAVAPEPGMPEFDIDEFLESRDTLYLIGANKAAGSIAPLFSCFTTALFNRAKHLASFKSPYDRHDPAVSFILDECALICPVPISDWAADSGGRGIWIAWTVQSMGQVESIYGADQARTLRDASNTWVILPGLKDTEFTEEITKICGKHDVKVRGAETHNSDGTRASRSVSIRHQDVMPVSRIREMRTNQALIVRRNARPVLVDYKPVWTRKEVKDAARLSAAARAATQAGYDPSEFQVPVQRPGQSPVVLSKSENGDE